jgi:hypothetical protein
MATPSASPWDIALICHLKPDRLIQAAVFLLGGQNVGEALDTKRV